MTARATGPLTPPRSRFVTVVAWLSIVPSGLTSLVGLLQVLSWPFGTPGAASVSLDEVVGTPLPPTARFVFAHPHLFTVVFLVGSVATFVASVGLLRRRPWARLAFIGVLVAGTLYGWIALAVQRPWLEQLVAALPADPDLGDLRAEVTAMIPTLEAAAVAVMLCATAFNALIVARLSSRAVRAEFDQVEEGT
jgi:hypothetical protein